MTSAPARPASARPAPTPRTLAPVGLTAALVAEAAAFAILLHRTDVPHHSLLLMCVTAPLYAVTLACAARARLAPARSSALVVVGGTTLQLIALTQRPLTSSDDYRYIWDGRVQFAGIDPYRYAPVAAQLSRLRDALLFPPGHCAQPVAGVCTSINRAGVHTVYPPVAQLLFDAVRVLSWGGRGGRHPFQIAGAIGAVAVTMLLLRWLREARKPFWLAGIWAWCPVVASELGNNAHLDWAAVLLSLLALRAGARRRPGLAGALLGAAIAVKVYPVLLLPALLRDRPRRVVAAAAALIGLVYLPHLVAVGAHAIGYLPGYLHEEGYTGGTRGLLLLRAVLPAPAAIAVAVALAAGGAALAHRYSAPSRPEAVAAHLAGAALLIASPNYGWYSTLLIALVVVSGRWEWLPVAFAPTFTYLYRGEWLHTGLPSSAIYALAGMATLMLFWLRSPRRTNGPQLTARARRGEVGADASTAPTPAAGPTWCRRWTRGRTFRLSSTR